MLSRISSTFLHLLCLSLLFSLGPAFSHDLSEKHDEIGFEVLLLRNSTTRNCDIVYVHNFQHHKSLRTSSLLVETRPLRCVPSRQYESCNAEQVLVLAKTATDVRQKVLEECYAIENSSELAYLGHSEPKLLSAMNDESQQTLNLPSAPPLDIHPLPGLVTGDSSNRVDIVFFSDGYTADEKDKFLSDATRLGIAITVNQTYAPVAPLLNFWGAFSPSVDSGIGVGGKPKNTVYGLYRDGTELRGVYTSKPEVARAACKLLGTQCNYPLLLGNDPMYGGLGGEFTISTASEMNGPLVLRHELGHSIIWIGDEYDGSEYFGANAAELSRNKSVSWAHWLSQPTDLNTPPRAERNAVPLLAYPWTILNTSTPWSTIFTSTGTFSSALLRFSLSAVPDANALEIKLDGNRVLWEAKRGVGIDRWFYDVWVSASDSTDGGLHKGKHELSFSLQRGGKEGLAQLCSVEVIEYGNSNEFNSTDGYVGAFPTYSPEVYDDPDPEPDRLSHFQTNPADSNAPVHVRSPNPWPTVSFRPTNEGCLMRQVAQPDFCVVCTEALWLRLLARVNLIDHIAVRSSCPLNPEPDNHELNTIIDISLVPLAHLRSLAGAAYIMRKGVKEAYRVRWYEGGKEVEAWRDLTRVVVECGRPGVFEVEVRFESSEIRRDEKGYTVDRKQVWVGL